MFISVAWERTCIKNLEVNRWSKGWDYMEEEWAAMGKQVMYEEEWGLNRSFNGQLHSLRLLLPVPPLLEHLSLPSCLDRLLPALLCVHLHSAQLLRFLFSRREIKTVLTVQDLLRHWHKAPWVLDPQDENRHEIMNWRNIHRWKVRNSRKKRGFVVLDNGNVAKLHVKWTLSICLQCWKIHSSFKTLEEKFFPQTNIKVIGL